MRSLVDLFLSPVALGPTSATPDGLRRAMRESMGPRGFLEELAVDGDPREPARIAAVFASPGRPEQRATLLFVHGKGGCGAEWRPDASRALRLGCNVLVPELRAHAPSTGARLTYGLFESVDLALLLADVARRFGVARDRVGVDACSMGALVALRLAAAPPGVAALWLQAPFGDLRSMAAQYVHRATGLPRALVALPAALAVKAVESRTGLALDAVDPLVAARSVSCPAVVVHGEGDVMVPVSMASAIYEALAGPKELWLVPRAGHCHHPDEPQAVFRTEYRKRWTEFFTRHLSLQT